MFQLPRFQRITFMCFLLLTAFSAVFVACKKDGEEPDTRNTPGGSGSCVGGPNTIADVDGNVYNVVTIGNQCWMKENLKTTKYRNGDPIPTNLSDTSWNATTSGAYAIFNNSMTNDNIYGKLYNWYAVADPSGLCPAGWHVPSDSEWTTLITYLGGAIAGGAMKEAGLMHWESPNKDATNSSGFSGLPGGRRLEGGSYANIGFHGFWWSSTLYSNGYPTNHYLGYTHGSVYRNISDKSIGLSVRCVRD